MGWILSIMPHESVSVETNHLEPRFRSVLEKANINQRQLADYLGVSRPYITHALHGKPISRPVMMLFEKLEREVARREQGGYAAPRDGSMLPPKDAGENVNGTHGAAPSRMASNVAPNTPMSIPVLSVSQACAWAGPESAPAISHEELVYAAADPKAFAVRVTGDAMSPHHVSGELAIVYPNDLPHDGDRVLARLRDGNGGALLFRIFHLSDHGRSVILSSPNPAYPALQYAREEFTWVHPIAATIRQMRDHAA
jgi:SOS-response transcriptional repressor LexA